MLVMTVSALRKYGEVPTNLNNRHGVRSVSLSDPGRSQIALPSFKLHTFARTLEISSTEGNLSYFVVCVL